MVKMVEEIVGNGVETIWSLMTILGMNPVYSFTYINKHQLIAPDREHALTKTSIDMSS